MRRISLLIYIAISILCSASIYAFDDERKGFILGGGLGVGYLSNTTSPGSLLDTDSRIVFHINFKIGYAPSNTLEIFYHQRISWWGQSGRTYLLGLIGAGFTLYFDNTSETDWFVSGGIGFVPTGRGRSTDFFGFGLFAGAGYEFSRHWTVEVDLLYSTVTGNYSNADSFGVVVTVNVLAF